MKSKKKIINFNNYIINDEYKETFNKLQEKIIDTCGFLSLITFILEIFFFIHYSIQPDPQFLQGPTKYLFLFLLKPSIINFLIYFSGKLLYKHIKTKKEQNISIPCLMLLFCSINIISTHFVFTSLYLLVIIPIFISNVYGNANIERKITAYTTLGSIIMFIMIATNNHSPLPERFIYNVFFTFLAIVVSHTISIHIIIHEKQKDKIILQKCNINKKLEEEVKYDGLTNLLNHKAFIETLNETCSKENKKVCLSIIDIDYFKEVNDNYGHAKGDVVLVKLAEMLQEIQSSDIIAGRYGGEEFCVILKNKTTEEAFTIIDELRKSFSKVSFSNMDKCVTFSAGITSFKDAENVSELFKKTDKALYKAKQNGRNNCIYENK